jgi:hypothetical protein
VQTVILVLSIYRHGFVPCARVYKTKTLRKKKQYIYKRKKIIYIINNSSNNKKKKNRRDQQSEESTLGGFPLERAASVHRV